MKNSSDLRMSFLNGYNKKDVQAYLEEMTHLVEEVRNEKERELASLKKKCTDLGLVNKTLEDEKKALEQALEDYFCRKDALARVEVDAQVRADQLIARAQLEIQERQEDARQALQAQQQKAQAELDLTKALADQYVEKTLTKAKAQMDEAYAHHVKRSTAYRHEVQTTLQQSQTVIREMDVMLSDYMELTRALKSGLMDLTAISNREILVDLPTLDRMHQELETMEIPVEELPVEELPVEELPVEELPVEELPVEELPVEEIPDEEAPVETTPLEELPDSFSIPLEELPLEPPVEETIPMINRKPCKTVEEMFQQILEDEAKA